MTYSYIFIVIGEAIAYQSSKFLCIHLSHLITVRVNNLLHPSCNVFMLWCCRLFAAWLVFQQFMTILQIVISFKHHTPSKTCEVFIIFIPKAKFYIRLLFKVVHFFTLKACTCIAHKRHILMTTTQYNCVWEGTYAEARLSWPLMLWLCSLVVWYFAVSYHVL